MIYEFPNRTIEIEQIATSAVEAMEVVQGVDVEKLGSVFEIEEQVTVPTEQGPPSEIQIEEIPVLQKPTPREQARVAAAGIQRHEKDFRYVCVFYIYK